MSTAIEFNNISKQYRLGLVSTKTLSHDLDRWWKVSVLHKEDPYLKIGSINDRASAADSEYVWALKGIDFKVEQGDVLGIIGKNGAGKSTLLKLLSKVTAPTTGTIRAKGRIGSLLEVGTGFHSEMTGRENIFMNGAILGMSKQEIAKKLDEIVDFSGCERYLDTPVKRYSSGMMVRLGFAVAAHLEPEILVVDEVLAVGDAEFQKKAIGKMQDVSQNAGRTVLFVSHNMASIRQLCKHGVLLEQGQVKYQGTAEETVDYYLESNFVELGDIQLIKSDEIEQYREVKNRNKYVEIVECERLTPYHIDSTAPCVFRLRLRRNNMKKQQIQITTCIDDEHNYKRRVGLNCSKVIDISDKPKEFDLFISMQNLNLRASQFSMNFWVGIGDITSNISNYDGVYNALTFEVDSCDKLPTNYWARDWGSCYFLNIDTSFTEPHCNKRCNDTVEYIQCR